MTFAEWIALVTGLFVSAGLIFLIVYLWKSFNEEPNIKD